MGKEFIQHIIIHLLHSSRWIVEERPVFVRLAHKFYSLGKRNIVIINRKIQFIYSDTYNNQWV